MISYLFLFLTYLFFLIQLKNIHEKHPLKQRKCKFKTAKIIYLKSQSRTTYDDSKNKSSLYP